MSENIKILYYALWLAHPVLQTVIAIAMLRRGQNREFKYFFAYVVTQIVTFAILFPDLALLQLRLLLRFMDHYRHQRRFGFQGDPRSLS